MWFEKMWFANLMTDRSRSMILDYGKASNAHTYKSINFLWGLKVM